MLIGTADSVAGQVNAMLVIGTALLTVGEITAGAGLWHVAFTRIPTTAPGQYQAVFGMSESFARVLGPMAALPLVLAIGAAGWLVLGLLIATAATALSVVALRGESRWLSLQPHAL